MGTRDFWGSTPTTLDSAQLTNGKAKPADTQTALRLTCEDLQRRLTASAADHQLAKTELSRMRGLFLAAQEDERRRISRDLHDHLGQEMTALRLVLASLKADCAAQPDLLGRIERAAQIAEKIDGDLDFLTWELRSEVLDEEGLTAALGIYLGEWSANFGVGAEYFTSGLEGERLPAEVEINLYRTAQEALNNTAKHADAENVTVTLSLHGDEVTLTVEDDGAGFDPQEAFSDRTGRGLGLVGMCERAELLGGTVEIESAAGVGTTVIARVLVSVAAEVSGRESAAENL
jgi:signal transduction histidine kinase